MFTFRFYYASIGTIEINHVNKVEYHSTTKLETISGDQILSTRFPIGKDIYLYGDGFSDTVAGKDLIHIEITSEK